MTRAFATLASTLTVFAAASLTDVMPRIDARPHYSFAGSGTLALQIQQDQMQINLSESLARVPGLVIQNRWNYAQDLQVSSRGFGARASFGARGIRLYQDGIPATMPDGQGQTGSFSLVSAKRIEVLRGPFSTLYGFW